jgi:RNA polymerase-binding transcription factor
LSELADNVTMSEATSAVHIPQYARGRMETRNAARGLAPDPCEMSDRHVELGHSRSGASTFRGYRWLSAYERDGDAVDTNRARELLAAERGRIEQELATLSHADESDAAEAEEFDAANRASDLVEDELTEGRAENLREQLAAVERAEARLAAGTYGVSVESGRPIPDERLEAVPAAERTVAEERNLSAHHGRAVG